MEGVGEKRKNSHTLSRSVSHSHNSVENVEMENCEYHSIFQGGAIEEAKNGYPRETERWIDIDRWIERE